MLHAPLTAIFLIAEITGGYVLFIPLMIVSAISYIIARLSNPHNMYWHDLIHEKKVFPGQDDDMLNSIEISRIIKRDYVTLDKSQPIEELYKLLAETNANVFAVLGPEHLLEGVIWLDEVRKQLYDSSLTPNAIIADVMVPPPAVIDYEQSAQEVMQIFDVIDVCNCR